MIEQPKYTRTCPRWDVPRQDRIIEDAKTDGWCLTNMSDRWMPEGGKQRVLTFRRSV